MSFLVETINPNCTTLRRRTVLQFDHKILGKISAAQSRTVLSTKQAISKFEGIWMNYGAEKSLTGLLAFKRYCIFTKQDTELIRSTETF